MKILPTLAATAILACSTATAADFSAQSADLKPGATIAQAQVYRGYGCQGNNTAPQIAWRNAPAGTRSFALTLFDPDANAGKGWWHWLVVDIPASAKSLSAGGKLPQGAFSLAGAQPSACARSHTRASKAWCPRCSPSNAPTVTTLPDGARQAPAISRKTLIAAV